MSPWLLGFVDPDGMGGYMVIDGKNSLDAIRNFRTWFGYAFTLKSIMPAP